MSFLYRSNDLSIYHKRILWNLYRSISTEWQEKVISDCAFTKFRESFDKFHRTYSGDREIYRIMICNIFIYALKKSDISKCRAKYDRICQYFVDTILWDICRIDIFTFACENNNKKLLQFFHTSMNEAGYYNLITFDEMIHIVRNSITTLTTNQYIINFLCRINFDSESEDVRLDIIRDAVESSKYSIYLEGVYKILDDATYYHFDKHGNFVTYMAVRNHNFKIAKYLHSIGCVVLNYVYTYVDKLEDIIWWHQQNVPFARNCSLEPKIMEHFLKIDSEERYSRLCYY